MDSPSPPSPSPLGSPSHQSTPLVIQGYLSHLSRIELLVSPSCYLLVGSAEKDATVPANDDGKADGKADPKADAGSFRILRILRQPFHDTLQIIPDPTIYTVSQMDALLHSLSPIESLCISFGLVGIVRFLDCYYITLITRRQKVGMIGGESIYTIKNTEMIPLRGCVVGEHNAGQHERERQTNAPDDDQSTSDDTVMSSTSMLNSLINLTKQTMQIGFSASEISELRYHGLFNFIDLTKNFLFSYTYDITNSLQHNILVHNSRPFPPPPPKSMYAWNHYQTRDLETATGANTSYNWCLPIVFGAFLQRKVLLAGKELSITLLARRSRHFAGTRYLKRGVSDVGKVANDVEHEQIVFTSDSSSSSGNYSSFIQMRGSIPTYWTQESSVTMPKPPIVLNRVDPTYKASQLHFSDLIARYGGPIVVLDLVKQSEKREREVIVGNEFRHAIEYLNSFIDNDHKIRYCALDYSHISKHRSLNVSKALEEVAIWAVNKTGFFCSQPKYKISPNGKITDFWEQPISSPTATSPSPDATPSSSPSSASAPPPPSPAPPQTRPCFTPHSVRHHLGVPILPMEQRGVLRTNCIDCLDRSNVAQFSAGVTVLAQQLVVMGIQTSTEQLESTSQVVHVLMDMYSEIGDYIALQYGGSEAHKKVASGAGGATSASTNNSGPSLGKHKEFLTSVRRYYSNTFTDRMKQDAMNLFLGYFVPAQSNVPMWELENDYYLHNFHVQNGTAQSMVNFRRNLAGYDEDESDADSRDTVDSSLTATKNRKNRGLIGRAGHKLKKVARRSLSPKQHLYSGGGSDRVASEEVSKETEEEESSRHQKEHTNQTLRVRKRCAQQSDLLSSWWRVAVQTYLQQRMWMHLDQPPETKLPEQFDRLYQPHLLTQFDNYFAHAWATPSRASAGYVKNKDQLRTQLTLTGDVDEFDTLAFEDAPRALSTATATTTTSGAVPYYMRKFGTKAKSMLTYKSASQLEDGGGARTSDIHLPEPAEDAENSDYASYVQFSENPGALESQWNGTAYQEFTMSLADVNLPPDEVAGIKKLAESAHITREIQKGPYEGLLQDTSAQEVAKLVHEQLGVLGSAADREAEEPGALGEAQVLVRKTLERSGMGGSAVADTIQQSFEELQRNSVVHFESFDPSNIKSMSSTLTDEESLATYNLFAVGSGSLVAAGSEVTDTAVGGGEETAAAAGGARVGGQRRGRFAVARDGFEQIHDDLFARTKNKFMVFNGVGMEDWSSSHKTREIDLDEYFDAVLR